MAVSNKRWEMMEKRMEIVEKSLGEIKDILRNIAIHIRNPPSPQSAPSPVPIQVQVQDFEGRVDPVPFFDWLASLEEFFTVNNLSEANKVRFTISKLKGNARIWWCMVEHKERVNTWETIKAMLKENFLPCQSSFMEMMRIVQGKKTVEEYTKEFLDYVVLKKISEPETEKVSRYRGGLRYDIQREMFASFPTTWTMDETYGIALKVEENLKSRSQPTSSSNTPHESSNSKDSTFAEAPVALAI